MASFRALNPPQTVTVTVGRGSQVCAHVFEDGEPHEIPDDHVACLKVIRRSTFFQEV